jgi:hypothetical protein
MFYAGRCNAADSCPDAMGPKHASQ